MKRAILAVVLVTGGVALAQRADPEDARAKAEAREAMKPATKAEVEALRAQVAQLRAELHELKTLIQEAKKSPGPGLRGPAVDANGNDLPTAAQVQQAIKEHYLLVGMTVAEVNAALGLSKNGGKLVSEEAGGVEIYEWELPNRDDYVATFRGGHMLSYNRISDEPPPRQPRTRSEVYVNPRTIPRN